MVWRAVLSLDWWSQLCATATFYILSGPCLAGVPECSAFSQGSRALQMWGNISGDESCKHFSWLMSFLTLKQEFAKYKTSMPYFIESLLLKLLSWWWPGDAIIKFRIHVETRIFIRRLVKDKRKEFSRKYLELLGVFLTLLSLSKIHCTLYTVHSSVVIKGL